MFDATTTSAMAATKGKYREKEVIFLSWVMEPAKHRAHAGDARLRMWAPDCQNLAASIRCPKANKMLARG
ncbi:hypothetical protein, partial [Mesorhizobium sp. M7A.F.Ca.US.006.04.2.1]|uniref:hypothetical protein n=1 Tax=Mesorhizobium sp. M7A.F.Ca.US.006.04.2.1 TaxID=2496696 RepID=UPI0019D4424F